MKLIEFLCVLQEDSKVFFYGRKAKAKGDYSFQFRHDYSLKGISKDEIAKLSELYGNATIKEISGDDFGLSVGLEI